MGSMFRLRLLTIAAVLAVPFPALAVTAADVAMGNIDVAMNHTSNGGVDRGATDETVAAFDTSNCTGFTVTPGETLPKTLTAADASLGFTASFTPAARTAYSCTVVIRDPGNANIGTFDITARGVAAELSVSTTALTFGQVKVGATSSRTFNVMNTGDAGKTLSIASIAASGGTATDFTASPSAFALGPGSSTTVTVTFNPAMSGARASQLIVTASNDPIDDTETIDVNGEGVAPVIGTANDPTNFGTVTAGSSAMVNVAVTNSGTGTLTVTSATIASGAGSWFSFGAAPQASCNNSSTTCDFSPDLAITTAAVNVAVRCAPPAGATGTQMRTLSFASDTAAGGDNSVTLMCTAGFPDATPSATSLSFGNVELNMMSAAQTLTITNNGTETLNISSANFVTNTQFNLMTGMTGAQNVAAGATASWNIRCYPNVLGAITDQFRITSNAANSPLNINLTCTGGRLTTNTLTFNFGAVRAGDAVTQTFILRNTGPDVISGINAAFSPQANAKGYTIASGLPTSLNGNSQATVTVRFLPVDTNSGTQAGENHTLTITGTYGAAQTTTTQTMSFLGDGLSSGYSFDPAPMLDLGNVRWDQQKTATFKITNPNEAPVQISSVMITPNAGTSSGELVRVENFTATTLQPNNGNMITLTVRADPANRLGALTGNIVVNSDLGATANPTRTLPVRANSTTPAITTDPANGTYDFGPVDVDRAGGMTKTFKLTNSGEAVLDVSTATISGANYSITAATPATVNPGADFSVTVTYDPSAVQTQAATLNVGVAGVFMGSMTTSFAITGRGIDRKFAFTDPGLFPETYRNPGSKAPVRDIEIKNLGEAPLNISAAMTTGEPVWSLVDPQPLTIPGGGTGTFKVKFSPTTGGKAPTGTLVLTHDDDTTAQPRTGVITLDGFGKNPMLSIAPAAVISLGTTAVGFPVRLSDAFLDKITVTNNDEATFKVRELKLRDTTADAPFALDDELSGEELEPGESRQFDIVFTAAKPGEFTAQLEIYLDEDTTPATVVQLTGTAVEVEVQGGGGCAATSSTGGAGWLVLLAVGGLLVSRKRRRAARAASLAVSALALALTASSTQAQSTSKNLDLSPFRPSPATTGELLQVESPFVGGRGEWEIGLNISYVSNPLQVTTMGDTFNLVSSRTVFDLGLAFAFADRFEVGARMSTISQSGDDGGQMVRGLEPGVGTAMGDALFHAKVALIPGVALATNVTFPTATDDAFAGPGKIAANGSVLFGFAKKRLTATGNLGFGYQDKVVLGNITQGNRALFGAGGAFRATDSLWLSAEMFGAVAIGQRERDAASPLEGMLGLRYRATRAVGISAGLGTGLMRGIGAPALRGVIAFELAPNARAVEPIVPKKPYVPPPDRDRDGVADAEDRCPDEAEDLDGFGDLDGCPDPDNDFDGIPDAQDKCPLVREDKDGVADDDGCPDNDDDGDNIPVPKDKCPSDSEDFDGFEDDDGCPDLDNDKDGILDATDKCPTQPETINGNQDDDGCPDAGESLILLGRERIDLVQQITFVGQTTKLTPETINVLQQVAATLRANPDISRLRIGVHVNRRGKGDQALTEKRAAALRDWLVQWGVEPHRLDIRGFGSTKLIVKATRKEAGAVNDRVELTIMERAR